jgi:hypothetical protein
VTGVKRVVNELRAVTGAKQAAVKVRDEDIDSEVKKAFDRRARARRASINESGKRVLRLTST